MGFIRKIVDIVATIPDPLFIAMQWIDQIWMPNDMLKKIHITMMSYEYHGISNHR